MRCPKCGHALVFAIYLYCSACRAAWPSYAELQEAMNDIDRAREAHRTGDVVSLDEFNRTINL